MAGGANGRIQPGFASGGSGGGLGGTTGGGMRSPEWGNAGYPDSGWGGNYGDQTGRRRPGFAPGGPNDPANGGSGYTGGGMGRIMAQNAFGSDMYRLAPGGPDDPADVTRVIGPDWNVQNPGMGYWPGGGHPLPPRWGNAGYPDSGWGGGPDWNVQNPGMPGGGQYPKEGVAGDVAVPGVGISEADVAVPGVGISEAAPDPWAGISQGRLGQARRFANVGQFGRAKQQIGLGGGNWDDVGGLLRTEAAANPYVKGQSMGFDWGDTSAGRLAEAKKMAASGKMGRAKQQFELGGGTWSPQMSHQMRAWQKGNK